MKRIHKYHRPADTDYSLLCAMAVMTQPFIRQRGEYYMIYDRLVNPKVKLTPSQFRRMRDAGYLLQVNDKLDARWIMPDSARIFLARKQYKTRMGTILKMREDWAKMIHEQT